jgi:hypothetical protein
VAELKTQLESESDAGKLMKLLGALAKEEMTIELLKQTGIGKTVGSSRLRKHSDEEVSSSACKLLKSWKGLVKGRQNGSSSSKSPPVSSSAASVPAHAETSPPKAAKSAPNVADGDDDEEEEDDDDFADAAEPAAVAAICTPFMKGKLGVKKGTMMWFGKWAGSRKAYKEGDVNGFKFEGPSGVPKHKDGSWLTPKSGAYEGFFKYGFGGSAEKVHEKDVAVEFKSEKKKGMYSVVAKGRNEYGPFISTGTYNARTQIIQCDKEYQQEGASAAGGGESTGAAKNVESSTGDSGTSSTTAAGEEAGSKANKESSTSTPGAVNIFAKENDSDSSSGSDSSDDDSDDDADSLAAEGEMSIEEVMQKYRKDEEEADTKKGTGDGSLPPKKRQKI